MLESCKHNLFRCLLNLSSQEDLVGQYDETLSDLRDLDYAKAISDLARQQLTYEAAQKTFAQVQGLSLFQYI